MNSAQRKLIRDLITKAKCRRETGLFVVEGAKMVSEAPPDLIEEIIMTREFQDSAYFCLCREVCSLRPCSFVTSSEMARMSDTVTPQGILAVLRQRSFASFAEFMAAERSYREMYVQGEPLFMLLEAVQDPGNLGTIMRSAEAAGVSALVTDEACAGIYSPKAVRSTMGSVFRLPCMCVESLASFITELRRKETTVRVYAACPHEAMPFCEADMRGASAILIGNESRGLSEAMLSLADQRIMIPMSGAAESLNASVAASVIAFEAYRQRSTGDEEVYSRDGMT